MVQTLRPKSRARRTSSRGTEDTALKKSPTGIPGFDEITKGGLPQGRPSLICGSAGCGKTLFSMEFLIRGATEFKEPGVFVSFEEREKDLVENVASLGFDLRRLQREKKIFIDHVRVEKSEIQETGEYDLEGLFVRLNYAIETIGAKRVVLDTIETLFSGLSNQGLLRAELRRLFYWLKEKGVTTLITGERGEGQLTRQGLEEYVSDCVILLDHRVQEQISTRRMRIVKYRGSSHGTNEYPFIIDEKGISVMPVTSLGLQHGVSTQRVSTGVERLDTMLGGKGFYRGSSILISGTAGTGKSTLGSFIADAACRRGERVLYFAFEESPSQIIRNMSSVGLNLKQWADKGSLQIFATRPVAHGLEAHLAHMIKQVADFEPDTVLVDPINNLISTGNAFDVQAMLLRFVDYLKERMITACFTSLSSPTSLEQTEEGLSSLMDVWILLRDIEFGGERNRGLYVLKARGMAHSNQIREYLITRSGIDLIDVYIGPEGVLTGSARQAQETRERAAELQRAQNTERKRRELERRRAAIEAQIKALRAEFETQEEEIELLIKQEQTAESLLRENQKDMARLRKADAAKEKA